MVRKLVTLMVVVGLMVCVGGCPKPADKVSDGDKVSVKPPAPPVDKPVALPAGKSLKDLKEPIEVPLADKAIKVDGKLTDAAWAKALAMTGFVTERGKTASAEATVLVAYDSDNLYLAVVCDEPKTADMVVKAQTRDGSTWNDDSVEIYIDSTNAKSGEYYGFFVNAKNVVYDRRRVEAWDGQWQSATDVVPEKAWIAELAIPWKTMNVTAKSGAKLGLMVARNRFAVNKKGEYFTLVQTSESKNTSIYPTLVLK